MSKVTKVIPGIYVSHLGGLFDVIGISASTVDNSLSVVMKPLKGAGQGMLFHTPLEQFLGTTTCASNVVPRFTRAK